MIRVFKALYNWKSLALIAAFVVAEFSFELFSKSLGFCFALFYLDMFQETIVIPNEKPYMQFINTLPVGRFAIFKIQLTMLLPTLLVVGVLLIIRKPEAFYYLLSFPIFMTITRLIRSNHDTYGKNIQSFVSALPTLAYFLIYVFIETSSEYHYETGTYVGFDYKNNTLLILMWVVYLVVVFLYIRNADKRGWKYDKN